MYRKATASLFALTDYFPKLFRWRPSLECDRFTPLWWTDLHTWATGTPCSYSRATQEQTWT
ncbi:hypothetical protein BgiBS90_030727, partial [Biomphalaria glabrata]